MGANEIFRPDVMKTIEETLTALDSELRELSLKIHSEYAHDTLTQFMSSKGFEVIKHYLGLNTAWRAEFTIGNGGRTLGVNSEMDALPGIGHACGHNLIAIAGVGIVLAVKTALEKHSVPGKVVLLGTPAEEGGGGKIIMIERGGYKDMDACVMCHPGPGPFGSVGTGPSLAFQSIQVEYFGHGAHASAAPWEAVNALDAAFLAYSNVSVLRQQMKPDHRVHGIVEGKDWAPNIIPDYAKMRWFIRAPTGTQLKVWRDRVTKCFEAAAHATGCKYTISYGQLMYDLLQNPALTEELVSTLHNRYGMTGTPAEGAIGGSTDFGNVTYELPSIHPSFAIPTKPGGGNHTVGFTEAVRTKEAHEATLQVAKGLALVGFRIINDETFFYKVKDSFHPNK
ncbi:hypothetical protein BDM02DRAFT_3154125 [Thelephora ganbajun]|uniref:Uncharacterized protein n=1 Tax=Thelephora ganbajun TaxID=370292 RepID=A0ACB6ZRJ5_THEGA|nr:hypothetical protein BDM02DRAFT_3154125 [Thelephora ganbajun]